MSELARLVVPAQRESAFTLNTGLKAAPRAYRIDPDAALLARITAR